MHTTTVQVMCLYNETTAVQFQPSQLKFSFLWAIPKHAIVILRAHNITREMFQYVNMVV